MKTLTLGFLLGAATAARAQTHPPTLVEKVGCILKASAYYEPVRSSKPTVNLSSRFDLELFEPARDPYHWDFVLPDAPNHSMTNIMREYGQSDYKTQKFATIRAILRQFDTLDERVTFRNLALAPVAAPKKGQLALARGPRFLALKEAQSITTPSGITVTLPASLPLDMQNWNLVFNGNIHALWVPIQVSPNAKSLAPLPDSPLFRKHGRAVSIKLEVPEPYFLVSYAADNTYTDLKIGFANLQTATHLDELTFIVRQR
ncbi:MAG TPA: hypothetical protein VF627_02645, partial [Abditibacterium sp.]